MLVQYISIIMGGSIEEQITRDARGQEGFFVGVPAWETKSLDLVFQSLRKRRLPRLCVCVG